ncbi:unnamed protein product, partial [Heterotrigona itama]
EKEKLETAARTKDEISPEYSTIDGNRYHLESFPQD